MTDESDLDAIKKEFFSRLEFILCDSSFDLPAWIRSRLDGTDTLIPYDKAQFESNEELIITLYQKKPNNPKIHETIESSCKELMQEYIQQENNENDIQNFSVPIIELIQVISPENCRQILEDAVCNSSYDTFSFPKQRNLLFTLTRYKTQSERLIPIYENALKDNRLAYIAYLGLRKNLERAVKYLPVVYDMMKPHEKKIMLPRMMKEIFKFGKKQAKTMLLKYDNEIKAVEGLSHEIENILNNMPD